MSIVTLFIQANRTTQLPGPRGLAKLGCLLLMCSAAMELLIDGGVFIPAGFSGAGDL